MMNVCDIEPCPELVAENDMPIAISTSVRVMARTVMRCKNRELPKPNAPEAAADLLSTWPSMCCMG